MSTLNGPEVMQAEIDPRPAVLGDRPQEEIGAKQWKGHRIMLLGEFEINIKFFNVGCVVGVGCQSFAFESIDKMMKELQFYVEHPYEAREKWNKIREEQK
jgi:hypothetical protein